MRTAIIASDGAAAGNVRVFQLISGGGFFPPDCRLVRGCRAPERAVAPAVTGVICVTACYGFVVSSPAAMTMNNNILKGALYFTLFARNCTACISTNMSKKTRERIHPGEAA